METVSQFLVLSVLGVWLLLSILTVAHSPWMAGRRHWDLFQVFSGWRLFVSSAGHSASFALLYRDRLDDGSLTPLLRVAAGTVGWSAIGVFWGPQGSVEVLIRRLIKDLRRDLRILRGDPAALMSSPAYRHLRHVVFNCPRPEGAQSRQFAIVATYGELSGRPPVRLFQSEFQDL